MENSSLNLHTQTHTHTHTHTHTNRWARVQEWTNNKEDRKRNSNRRINGKFLWHERYWERLRSHLHGGRRDEEVGSHRQSCAVAPEQTLVNILWAIFWIFSQLKAQYKQRFPLLARRDCNFQSYVKLAIIGNEKSRPFESLNSTRWHLRTAVSFSTLSKRGVRESVCKSICMCLWLYRWNIHTLSFAISLFLSLTHSLTLWLTHSPLSLS